MTLVLKKGATPEEMKALQEKLDQLPTRKRIDARKYSGTIRVKEDPLVVQKRLRDEWE